MAFHSRNYSCFVCSESVDQSFIANSNKSSKSSCSKVLYEFFSFSQRYLKLNTTSWCHDTKFEVFCEPCLVKVKNVCRLYEKLCEAEIRLSTQLGELGRLLKQPRDKTETDKLTQESQKVTIDGIRNYVAGKCLEKFKNVATQESANGVQGKSSSSQKELRLVETDDIKPDPDEGEVEYIFVEKEDDDDDSYQEESLLVSEHDPLAISSPTSNIQEAASDEYDPMSGEDGNCREDSAATGASFRKLYQKVQKLRRDNDKESDYDSETEASDFEHGSDKSWNLKTESSNDSESTEDYVNEEPQKKPRPQKISEARKTVISTIASGTNGFTCVECGRPFLNPDDLYVHLEWHERKSGARKPSISCYFCYKSFVFNQTQQLHIQLKHATTIVKDNPFNCDEKECGASFGNFPDLDNHIATHSKPIHNCSLCHWRFVNVDNLQVHKVIHTPNNNGYQCPACDLKTRQVKNLQSHYYRKHGPGVGTMTDFTCPECNVDFACRDYLKMHMKKLNHSYGENGEPERAKNHVCPHCNAPFFLKQTLLKHISKECEKNPENDVVSGFRTKSKSGKFVTKVPCHVCAKLVYKEYIKKHMKTHLPKKEREELETRVICETCGASVLKHCLKNHMNNVHKGIKRKRVECEHCEKTFSTQFCLNHHINTIHKGIDTSVICDLCGKKFANPGSLRSHKQTHEEQRQKPNGCHLCPSRFLEKKTLRKHLIRQHGKTEGEEFTPGEGVVLNCVCMFRSCDAKFGTDIELKSHVGQSHSPAEKEFMCGLCGKVFAYQARLTRHNLVHTQEKPHECPVCSKRFNYRASLKEHIAAMHEQQCFECEQPNCESKFKVRKYLWRHLRDVHGVISVTTQTNDNEGQK